MYAQVNNYNVVSTKKDIKVSKITMFSDIHYVANFDLTRLGNIIKITKDSEPDYICIPGDILDNSDVVNNKNEREILIDWLKSLSAIAKTIISIGNHDIMRRIDNQWKLSINEQWLRDIQKISNLILLQNSIYEDREIRFIGFNPSIDYYEKDEEDIVTFLIEINMAFKSAVDNGLYNILLCHTPTNIFKDYIIKNTPILKNIDLVLSGHIHGGLVPPFLERFFQENEGFIGPNGELYPSFARGMINKGDMTGIISTGITKLGSSTGILQKFNVLFPANINNIEITSKVKTNDHYLQ